MGNPIGIASRVEEYAEIAYVAYHAGTCASANRPPWESLPESEKDGWRMAAGNIASMVYEQVIDILRVPSRG